MTDATEYEKEANRLLYLHVNGGGGNPDLHKRLAALLKTERDHSQCNATRAAFEAACKEPKP